MIESAASATRDASLSSEPYCFEAIAGFSADARAFRVRGVDRLYVESSGHP